MLLWGASRGATHVLVQNQRSTEQALVVARKLDGLLVRRMVRLFTNERRSRFEKESDDKSSQSKIPMRGIAGSSPAEDNVPCYCTKSGRFCPYPDRLVHGGASMG